MQNEFVRVVIEANGQILHKSITNVQRRSVRDTRYSIPRYLSVAG